MPQQGGGIVLNLCCIILNCQCRFCHEKRQKDIGGINMQSRKLWQGKELPVIAIGTTLNPATLVCLC